MSRNVKKYYTSDSNRVLQQRQWDIYNFSQLGRYNFEKLAFFGITYYRNSLRKSSSRSLGYLATADPWEQVQFWPYVRSLNLTEIAVSLTEGIFQMDEMLPPVHGLA